MDYPEGAPREVERECREVERALPTLEELTRVEGLRTLAARAERYQPPAQLSERFRDEWAGLHAALEVARQSCGWAAR